MSITETTYRPSALKVEKKNTKYELSRAVVDIFNIIGDLDDTSRGGKDYAYAIGRIQTVLLTVL